MGEHSHAHEREQAEAALNECCAILRRIGVSAMCCVGTGTGHTYRLISAPNGRTQAHLMSVVSVKLTLELSEMAKMAAELVDEDNTPTYLDDIKRKMDEGEDVDDE